MPVFNCEFKTYALSSVVCGVVGGEMLNRARQIDVPFLTNHLALRAGEELIAQVKPKATGQSADKKRTWRDAAADLDKKRQSEEKSAKQSKQKIDG